MTDLLLHFIIGLVAGATGYFARGVCRHGRHHAMLTVTLVFVESWIAVNTVG